MDIDNAVEWSGQMGMFNFIPFYKHAHLLHFIHLLAKLLLDPHLEDAGFGAPLWSGGPAMVGS